MGSRLKRWAVSKLKEVAHAEYTGQSVYTGHGFYLERRDNQSQTARVKIALRLYSVWGCTKVRSEVTVRVASGPHELETEQKVHRAASNTG